MNDELMKEIQRLACKVLAGDWVEHTNNWNGYEVWEPMYNEVKYVSFYWYVVLVKDGKARISTDEEASAYEMWCIQQENAEKGESN
mgnify:CR=1 FL=1